MPRFGIWVEILKGGQIVARRNTATHVIDEEDMVRASVKQSDIVRKVSVVTKPRAYTRSHFGHQDSEVGFHMAFYLDEVEKMQLDEQSVNEEEVLEVEDASPRAVVPKPSPNLTHIFRHVSPLFVVGIGTLVFGAGLGIALSYVFSFWLNQNFGLGEVTWSLVYLGLLLLSNFVTLFGALLFAYSKPTIGTSLFTNFVNVLHACATRRIRVESQALTTAFSFDLGVVDGSVVPQSASLFGTLLVVVSAVIGVALVSTYVLALFAVTIPLSILLTVSLAPTIVRANEFMQGKMNKLQDLAGVYLRGGVMFQVYRVAESYKLVVKKLVEEYTVFSTIQVFIGQKLLSFVIETLFAVFVVGCVFLALFQGNTNAAFGAIVLTKVIQIPELSVVVFQNFSGLWNSLTNLARLYQLGVLYAEEASIDRNGDDASWPADSHVEIRHLCSARLKDITLDFKPGELVAIVGRSGAGKSSLLTSFVDPSVWTEGSICVSGRSLADVTVEMLKRAVVLVPQKCMCFDGTLRQNIDVDSTASDEELVRLLQAFGSDTCDLDAVVLSSTVSASQGLVIGLVRAWLRNAAVMLLDEAIDTMNTIDELKKLRGKVIVAVMHHLQYIQHFDRVVVMAEGQVLEQGSPKVLLLDDKSNLSLLMKVPC